ncbi:XIAP-associated factor 1 [Sorex fumeus]|uniref:XIAP-associated factor 1 n=1 Tax=Sorex fumeus TaxID=62283 RepID=UPI0024ADC18D|nr:XIAP-associated factor 1 [Sorex fumeus]
MEGDWQECRNCKRRVASANLALHEAHCLRFLVLCPECKEPQPQEKMEAHIESKHRQLAECQEHVVCQFCELALSLNKLETHERHCGNQMEQCLGCGWNIPLRGLVQHLQVCQSEWVPPGKGKRISASEKKIHCHHCNQMIPGNEYSRHMDKCHTVTESKKSFPIGISRIPSPSLPNQTAKGYTSTAEKDVRPKTRNSKKFPPLSEKSTKKTPRGRDKTKGLPLQFEHTLRITSPVEDEAAYDILRGCSQCGILLPLPTLNQHQEKCWWLASLKEKQVRNSSYIWQRKDTDLFNNYR